MNQTDINTLIVERDAARAEVERLTSSAICAYCEGVVPIGSITLHVELCDKHPISKLRAENERLRAALEKYADIENWSFNPDRDKDCWNVTADGWEIAKEALENHITGISKKVEK